MIIGNGDVASVLPNRDDLIFFASGVSNSKETRQSEFRREKELLLEQIDHNKPIVYFGSLSIFYSDTPYAKHKRKMEQYVRMFPRWTIIRLGNISWGTNPHTIINYFKEQKARGEELMIEDAYRYVVDKDEFLHWINLIPDFNCEINIPGRRLTIKQIVEQYVNT